jgi:hypothetical protein
MALPKYLLADDDAGAEFVVHLEEPRALIRFEDGQGRVVLWFDDEADFVRREQHAGREPAAELARMMRQAAEFYATGDFTA